MGKLLTCYAPFRRSPPEYCYPALPLDLHVLSLPLAFILSQDQTLLCIFLIFLSLTWRFVSLRNWRSRSFCFWYLLPCTFLQSFQWSLSVLGAFRPAFPDPFLNRGCKGRNFFWFRKTFLKFFWLFYPPAILPQRPSFQTGLQRYYFFLSLQTFPELFFTAFRTRKQGLSF